jgi:hypothetical protein
MSGKRYSEETKLKIIKDYQDGMSGPEIEMKYGLSNSSVYRLMERRGLKRREPNWYDCRKYKVMDDFFDNCEEENAAYWAGMLMADGCVSDKTNAIEMSLKIIDEPHLKKFAKEINYDGDFSDVNLKPRKENGKIHPGKRIRFCSKKIKRRLISLGVTPRKSLTSKVCDELKYNKHFWRGEIDGDGWVGIYKNRRSVVVGLSGSKYICEQFSDFLMHNYGFTCSKVIKNSHHDGYKVSMATKGYVYSFLKDIYFNNSGDSLDRKRKKAEEIVKFYEEVLRK